MPNRRIRVRGRRDFAGRAAAALLGLLLAGLAAFAGLAGSSGAATACAQDSFAPPGVERIADLEYARLGERSLRLDLYLPSERSPEDPSAPGRPSAEGGTAEGAREDSASSRRPALPVVLWIHGGAWRSGSKDPCPAALLVPLGFAAASVEYRLSGEAPFPAQIEDVKASVRWLRANAGRFGLDPDRIGAWGMSAGGHLAALLGTAGDAKDLEGSGGNPGVSSRVAAVCDFCGPTDLLQFDGHGSGLVATAPDSLTSQFLGGLLLEKKDLAARANPIAYVTPDDPPFLILHGEKDTTVPVHQSEILAAALREARVPVEFRVVPGAGHGFWDPGVEKSVVDFFEGRLRPPPPAPPPAPSPVPAPAPAEGTPPESKAP